MTAVFLCDKSGIMAEPWAQKRPWDELAFRSMLDRLSKSQLKPLWVLVPDVVANKEETLAKWETFAPVVASYGFDLAFAAQDGMTPEDVPGDANVVFIGGSTEWKWRAVEPFCKAHPRVHVGRVNTVERLWLCEELGAESVDGTGWFRDGEENYRLTKLEHYLAGEKIQFDLAI